MKYRKKPVVVEAFQMTHEARVDNRDWPEWLNAPLGTTLSIGTLEGEMLVDFGDYIIQGVKGELYPCKPDIFEATYDLEMVQEAAP
jgi:hypothetical protein